MWVVLGGLALFFSVLLLIAFVVVEPLFALLFVVAVVLLVRRILRVLPGWPGRGR